MYHFLLFFFLPHACLYFFIVLCLIWLVNSWFFLSISWSARFLCVSIITSLYARHHFSEPTLYICPYFLQVFLLLLCFSVFVFCFVIKYSQFCIFPLRVLENTLHLFLCFFLLFPLFLFSAFQCYFVVLHQTLLATLLLFFPMSWSLHCSTRCISSCCSFSLCISVFFAVHFFKIPLSPALFLLSECVDSLFLLSLAGTPAFNQQLPVRKITSSSSTHHQLVTAFSTIASLALGSLPCWLFSPSALDPLWYSRLHFLVQGNKQSLWKENLSARKLTCGYSPTCPLKPLM